MKIFFQQNRMAIALVAMTLWFGGLNFCAFGLLAGGSTKGCPICHHDNAQSATSFCDKYSNQEAATVSPHGSIALFAALLPVINLLSLDDIHVVQPHLAANLRITDPPGEQSFAELILQKSLFAQAPPLC